MPYRHFDFTRIHDEFVNYYKTLEKGESEYYSWLKALSLDESKPYGSARESFKWAKSMLNYLKEDAENKYYGVLVGLPIRSMNQNVYRERDLIVASLSLKGKHPSLNHKDNFWFNEQSRWGTLTIEDAKYEDGAIEAVLKVPKTAVCPICNGAKMTELIDKRRIVNVSLEGSMEGAFEFTDPPFTLLTTDVLPGIPLARIKPLETIMVEALQVSTGKKETKIMKIKATIKEDTHQNIGDPANTTVNTSSITDPNLRGTWGGEVHSDAELHNVTDNAQTVMGTDPETQKMQSGDPMTDKMVGSNTEAKVSEPFAGYTDFADCVAKNSDKEDPDAYCASIKNQAECMKCEGANQKTNDTSQPKPDMHQGPDRTKAPSRNIPEAGSLPSADDNTVLTGESPVNKGVWTGTSPVTELLAEQVARIRAETKAATAHDETEKLREAMNRVETIWSEKYMRLSEEHQKQIAMNQSQEQILKQQREQISKEQLRIEDLRVELRDVKNQFADATTTSNKYSRLVEDLKIENAELHKKYAGAIQINLELIKKNTAANEEYLELAKQKDAVDEDLKKARLFAKRTLKITA